MGIEYTFFSSNVRGKTNDSFWIAPSQRAEKQEGSVLAAHHQSHCQPHISWVIDVGCTCGITGMLCHKYRWQRDELLLRWARTSVQRSAEGKATRLSEKQSTQEVPVIEILFHYCFLTYPLCISTWWMGSVIMQLQEEMMLWQDLKWAHPEKEERVKIGKIQLTAKTALWEATNTNTRAAPKITRHVIILHLSLFFNVISKIFTSKNWIWALCLRKEMSPSSPLMSPQRED